MNFGSYTDFRNAVWLFPLSFLAEGAVWSLAINQTGSLLASSGADGTVRLWTLEGIII